MYAVTSHIIHTGLVAALIRLTIEHTSSNGNLEVCLLLSQWLVEAADLDNYDGP